MDIKQLKFLIALDETRHFGQAAARCHITQPTLSMRLRSLEQELDLQLVNRGQRFESFTAPGERVLAWARTVLAAYDGLQAEAAACRGNLIGTLRLGVVPLSSFDVYEEEAQLFFEDRSDLPLQDDVLARLLTFPNVIITAHQAFLTRGWLSLSTSYRTRRRLVRLQSGTRPQDPT